MASPSIRPPRLARFLAEVFLRGDAREVIVGDLEQEFADGIAAGHSHAAAVRRYWRQTIASIASVHRHSGDRMTSRSLARIGQGISLDLRSVIRALKRSPGYASVAILSLAIGISANTAIVSVTRQLLLSPLPIERPEELKMPFWSVYPKLKSATRNMNSTGFTDRGVNYRGNYTYPEFEAMQAAAGTDFPFAGYNILRRITIAADQRAPKLSSGLIVTGRFFDVLRPRVLLGRALNELDDRAGAPLAVVIDHGLWTSYFGADPSVVGKTLKIGEAAATIVGVTGEGYRGLSPGGFMQDAEVMVPMAAQPVIAPEWLDAPDRSLFTDPEQHWIRAVARVPADHQDIAASKLTAAFRGAAAGSRLTPAEVSAASLTLFAAPRGMDSLRNTAAQPLTLLSIVVGIVLLIASTNVAGLMLARGVSRQRELSVRRALGASRLRVVRELLLESVTLSLIGGIAGILLASAAASALERMLTSGFGTRGVGVTLDWATLAVTFSIAVGVGILAGLIPALKLSGSSASSITTRGASGAPRLLIGRVLLAVQVAISLPLVAGAGLFLRTLHNLASIELGFDPRHLVLFSLDPTMNGRSIERGQSIYPRLLERLESVPGVSSATYIENALLSGLQSDTPGHVPGGEPSTLLINRVGPHYLETMGVRLIAGRAIDARDNAAAPLAGVINESAARKFFGSESPLGRELVVGPRSFRVVGVFADARYQTLKTAIAPTMLQSYQQNTTYAQFAVVRTQIPPAEFRQQLPDVLRDVDPNLPFSQFKTQTEQINDSVGKERVFSQLLTLFGGFALLLACIGLHGVTSYAVTRRTSEIGIRLALGAQRGQVLWMILRQVLALAAIGAAIGLPVAWLAGPAVQSMLYGLAANDRVTIGAAVMVMIAVALFAGWLPARRAARMEALAALRTD
jgi:predicted permease